MTFRNIIFRTITLCAATAATTALAQTKDGTVADSTAGNGTRTAQTDTLKRRVEIIKEYNPTIREASKVNIMPQIESNATKKLDVNYNVWATPALPEADSMPSLDYATAAKVQREYKRTGFLKLGAGNYKTFLGELYAPVVQTKKNLVELGGMHRSSRGDVDITHKLYKPLHEDFKTQGLVNNNHINAKYTHTAKGRELSAVAGFGYRGLRYYGYDGREEAERDSFYRKQAFTDFNAGVRYRTLAMQDKWRYDAAINYNLFHTRNPLNEHTIDTRLNGGYLVDNGYIDLDLQMSNIFLSVPDDSVPLDFAHAENTHSHTVIIFSPAYVFKNQRSELHIGVKGAFAIGQGRPASITPDLYGKIDISQRYWQVYAGITGDYSINSYRNMSRKNRYLAPDNRPEDTYTPIDIYIGSRINVMKYALLNLSAGYKVIHNPFFYINKPTADSCRKTFSYYDITYGDDEGLLTLGAELNTQWKERADLGVKFHYNKWAMGKDETPWMMPSTVLNVTLGVLPLKDLRLWVAYNFAGGRKAAQRDDLGIYQKVSMKNISDLSLGATYKAISWLSIFANFNNILSAQYDTFYGYASQKFNFDAGLIINF